MDYAASNVSVSVSHSYATPNWRMLYAERPIESKWMSCAPVYTNSNAVSGHRYSRPYAIGHTSLYGHGRGLLGKPLELFLHLTSNNSS